MTRPPSSGPTLRERIEDDRVYLFDGAMGTELYDRGVFVNACYDDLVREQPELVRRIHADYVLAGADIIETNTFGANPVKLSGHGLEGQTEEINRVAAELARDAIGEAARRSRRSAGPVHVVGAVGPLGVRIEPWGPTSVGEAKAAFGRQIRGLLQGGVDGICLETFGDLHELAAALAAVREQSDVPVVAQVTITASLATSYGTDIAHIAGALGDLGADVVGLNCSVGPAAILEGIEELARHTELPLSAQPNAGLPRTVRDRKMYMARPEYVAQYARRLIEAGARFVGGCCGTTPGHVARIADVVRSRQPKHASVRVLEPVEDVPRADVVPLADRSRLGSRIAEGGFVTSVEVVPPRGWDTGELRAQVDALREAGVDVVSLVDSSRGGRMGAIPAAFEVRRWAGEAPESTYPDLLVHYTCRDRNMMGMVADLFGAAAGGIRNLLVVTGDPPVQGPYPDSTAVFDIDSIGLTNVVSGMNRGVDPGGASIGRPTAFVVGVAANPSAVDLEREVERFHWKADAGADFAVTQPIFDPAGLERFLDRTRAHPLPVLAGIWPLTSLRNTEFLANEVPGVAVPREVLERMRRAQERGEGAARAEGVAIAREVAEEVARLEPVAGLSVTAPGGDVAIAIEALGPP